MGVKTIPVLTYSDFSAGLDVSRLPSVAGANQLRELSNAYVTTGKSVKKRPGTRKVADLEPGTVGLTAGLDKLNTFYGVTPVSHANSLFHAHKLPFPGSNKEVAKIHFGDVFLGFLYVVAEYADGSVRHFYLDDPGAWSASTTYTQGQTRRPTTGQGDLRFTVTTAGTSGASEPTWPTTIGGTVSDGTVTWTAQSLAISDANCPNSKSALIAASKIFATDGDVVRFSGTNAPRDWTKASDAGFLPTGLQVVSSGNALGLGRFNKYLAVFQRDAVQLWNVDPDPANMSYYNGLPGLGTQYPKSIGNLSGDIYFLSDQGFRSVTLLVQTQNMRDLDVGSPIDPLVQPFLAANPNVNPTAMYYPAQGQYICAMGSRIWVYTFSRTAKISAWSTYDLRGINVDYVASLDGTLYIRDGDSVYALDPTVFDDVGLTFDVRVSLPYLDMKAPGVLKQIVGVDAVFSGTALVSFGYDPNDPTQVTEELTLAQNTQPGELTPAEITATNVSPIIRHSAPEAFELAAVNLLYQPLGPV